jgi:microsomal epoxide hydrolase
MAGYDNIPQGANVKVDKFTLSISDEEITDFKTLLRLSKLAPQTYENLHTDDGELGVSHEWMSKAKEYWLNEYDWRTVETYNNSFPNYIAHIKDDDGEDFRIHFAALFSKRDNAIPLLYMHGWPGSHFEFLDILTLYREKYSSPEDLPYHIIAVSLPGWTLSSGPPLTKDFGMEDIGRIMNKLMLGLGFGSGYVLQGGDIGSFTAAIMSGTYDECKGESCQVLTYHLKGRDENARV